VTFASSAHVLILDLLRQAGLKPETDVALINLPAPNLLAAYRGQQIDAAVAWTPAFERLKALPDTRVLADDTAFSLFKEYGITPARRAAGQQPPDQGGPGRHQGLHARHLRGQRAAQPQARGGRPRMLPS
jgi:ABC-type nitrate/sulfonate/bicarbonate transport system substrate-binding protein